MGGVWRGRGVHCDAQFRVELWHCSVVGAGEEERRGGRGAGSGGCGEGLRKERRVEKEKRG